MPTPFAAKYKRDGVRCNRYLSGRMQKVADLSDKIMRKINVVSLERYPIQLETIAL